MINKQEKKYTWALKLFLNLTVISSLLTINHWPFAKEIGIGAICLLAIFYPLRYKAKKEKVLLDHLKLLYVIIYIVQNLILERHFLPLTIISVLIILFWLFSEGLEYFDLDLRYFFREKEMEEYILDDFNQNKKVKPIKYVIDFVFVASLGMVMLGFLFKILHLPFASMGIIWGTFVFSIVLWFKKF